MDFIPTAAVGLASAWRGPVDFAAPNPMGYEITDLVLTCCLGFVLLWKGFGMISAQTCLAACGLVSWVLGFANFYSGLPLSIEVALLFFLSPQTSTLLLALGLNAFVPSCTYLMCVCLGALPATTTPIKLTMCVVSVLFDFWYFDSHPPVLAMLAVAAWWMGRFSKLERGFGFALFLSVALYAKPLYQGVALSGLMLVALYASKPGTADVGEDEDWTTLLPMLRSFLWPLPGVARFGQVPILSASGSGQLALGALALCVVWLVGKRVKEEDAMLFGLFTNLASRYISPQADFGLVPPAVATVGVVLWYCGPVSRKRLAATSVVWLALALALAPSLPPATLDAAKAERYCRDQVWSEPMHWQRHHSSARLAADELHALGTGEPPFCRNSFPTALDRVRKLKIAVVGDSIGRFVFYSLANELVNATYGFPQASFHKDIHAAPNLSFYWSPFADKLEETAQNLGEYDAVIFSVGLWDKLHDRNVTRYEERLNRFFHQFAHTGARVWLEMSPCVDSKLAESKKTYLVESTADEWRQAAQRAARDRARIMPTKTLYSGRPSRDGVHYDMFTYQALARLLMRGL
ncbi:hypothetical protein BASA81_003659 [Batrachochytrium salamandrivorans]|nr:hypothetical protein BASA81_003659 [Batrachochytrium salamandrivorans]